MNKPSAPGTFTAPYKVEMEINFDDQADDHRRIVAELWCCYYTEKRWFRRVLTRHGVVIFEFEDIEEATLFRLSS
jgi:phosphoribosylaminoimidazole carboxylase (NCAIR synthetase)